MTQSVALIDWNFFAPFSHNASFASSFLAVFPYDTIYANKALPAETHPDARRLFDLNQYRGPKRKSFHEIVYVIQTNTHVFWKSRSIRANKMVVQDTTHYNLLGFLLLAALQKEKSFSFIFHGITSRKMLSLLRDKKLIKQRNVSFFAVDQKMAHEIETFSGKQTTWLPWPVNVTPRRLSPLNHPSEVTTFLVPGRYFKDKMDPNALLSFMWSPKLFQGYKVKLLIHRKFESNVKIHTTMKGMKPFVLLEYFDFLADDIYLDQMESADFILLPYSASVYRHKISAIAIEAAAMGKPVILPRRTLALRQVDSNDSIISYDPHKKFGLSKSLAYAVVNKNSLQKEAMKAASSIRERHDPKNVFSILLD